jgi:hypothetical protein
MWSACDISGERRPGLNQRVVLLWGLFLFVTELWTEGGNLPNSTPDTNHSTDVLFQCQIQEALIQQNQIVRKKFN